LLLLLLLVLLLLLLLDNIWAVLPLVVGLSLSGGSTIVNSSSTSGMHTMQELLLKFRRCRTFARREA
jgi:hypothetical protein